MALSLTFLRVCITLLVNGLGAMKRRVAQGELLMATTRRERFVEEMLVRGLSERTRQAYLLL